MLKRKAEADALVAHTLEEWGEREAYHATAEEITLLAEAGAKVLEINKDNQDGTLSHKVVYLNLTFVASSIEPINAGR